MEEEKININKTTSDSLKNEYLNLSIDDMHDNRHFLLIY